MYHDGEYTEYHVKSSKTHGTPLILHHLMLGTLKKKKFKKERRNENIKNIAREKKNKKKKKH